MIIDTTTAWRRYGDDPVAEDHEVYTIIQAAARLKISKWTLRKWIKQGDVRAYKLGHQWRITEEELARLMGRASPPPQEPEDL